MTKACRICLETKPLDDFQKDKRAKDGHIGDCRSCHKEIWGEKAAQWVRDHADQVRETKKRHHERNRDNPEYRARMAEANRRYKAKNRKTPPKPPVPEGMKFCIGCQTAQPLDAFMKDKRLKDGLQGRCRPCWMAIHKEHSTRWSREHPDLAKEAHRIAHLRRYQDPEYVAKMAEQSRRYAQLHPDRRLAAEKRRQARKLNAPVNDFTPDQWQTLVTAYNHRCAYCGDCPKTLTTDHVASLFHGGSHTASNILPACRSCNAKKGPRAMLPLRVLPDFLDLMLFKHG